jgi:Protein of unknown function (DUF2975)
MSKTSAWRISTTSLYVGVTVVFWLTMVGVAIGIPAGIATMILSDHPMAVHATIPAHALGQLPWDVTSVDRVDLGFPIDHLTGVQIAVYNGVFVIFECVLLFGLWQLRRLVRTVKDGDAFTSANVWRLRLLGSLLVFGYPIYQYVTGGLNEWILSTGGPDVPGARVEIDPFSLVALFGGLCLLVLAEVFANGIRLREDVEATV